MSASRDQYGAVIICATCRKALDLRTNSEGVSYTDTIQDVDDHPVVPVNADAAWRGRCDFCNEGTPSHVLPARDFRAPGLDLAHSQGAWAACPACLSLIERNQWNRVELRALDFHHRATGVPMSGRNRSFLRHLYRELRKNQTGAPIALPEPPEEEK